MKINTPVTNSKVLFPATDVLISKTNLKGAITYVNQPFIKVSGFELADLLGKSHNVVRHPDMPVEVFQDLWNHLKAGEPWRGFIKNRTKSGDYYWVDAHVTLIKENGQVIEYMSVRYAPTVAEIVAAENLYRSIPLHQYKQTA